MNEALRLTEWRVGPTTDPAVAPKRWVPATVPGAVQLDWARAEKWAPYWYGNNCEAYAWMEDRYWVYETSIPAVVLEAEQRLFFVCGGVDYQCDVWLGDRLLHRQEGMFTPFEFDCSDAVGTSAVLRVMVHPAPKRHAAPADRSQASACVKPPVSYGWDWHPRLIPLGIWETTGFVIRHRAHLHDVELRYAWDERNAAAHCTVTVHASSAAEGREVVWLLRSPGQQEVASGRCRIAGGQASAGAVLEQPELWWPRRYGGQPLYQLEARLSDGREAAESVVTQRVGFRRIRLVMAEGAWHEPAEFPKSRSLPPTTLEVNGCRLFAKGSNWVAPEIFPGLCSAATYEPLLELACGAHFNLLRCWGGAPVPKEAFFARCDELGLLVWQKFPLACNLYPDDPAYLAVLDRESRSIIRRLRRHPSLALWCGGNELFNAWSGMTDQALPLRLLNRNCYELDPATPFLPTAPMEGMAHGGYQFRGEDGREVFQVYAASRATAYSEFGCPGPSPVAYLQTFLPPDEWWPPRPGTAWETHHAFGAWLPDTWLGMETQEHYFGQATALEQLVARGEWLQAVGYQCIFEEARRQKPRCAMALNWCFNEPWPTAANNSLVNWPAQPKPAYHAVAAACRPVLASARLPKFSWQGGEVFSAELWVLQDGPSALPAGTVRATLVAGDERRPVLTWNYPAAAAEQNVTGPVLRVVLPVDWTTGEFTLRLEIDGRPECTSCYRLHYRPVAAPGADDAACAVSRRLNT